MSDSVPLAVPILWPPAFEDEALIVVVGIKKLISLEGLYIAESSRGQQLMEFHLFIIPEI
jgi:hypothetical protein